MTERPVPPGPRRWPDLADNTKASGATFDAASVLTIYVILLLGIPSVMVLAPLGSAGSPSTIMAVAMFLLWLWFQVHRSNEPAAQRAAVSYAALGWLLVMLIVYGHAMSGPISFDEISPADFGMLKLIGLVGVLLVASDGLSDPDRVRTLAGRLVVGVGLVAVLGLLQFVTRQLFVDLIHIPGLTSITNSGGLIERGGHPRPSGTSTHPIEYGVVLSMTFPLVIVHALWAPTHRWLYRVLMCVIALDIFLSSSRSALVCAIVAVLVLGVGWPRALRLKALLAAAVVSLIVYLTVPGSLGATTRLFTGAGDDPSIASRTGSYDIVEAFFSRSPVFGRGFGTFLPKYWILDNGYLGLLIEGGLIGVAGLLILIVVSLAAVRRVRRSFAAQFDRQLAQGVTAAVVSGAAGLAFFDTFGFPQSAGCFFLILGLAGALRRLAPQPGLEIERISPAASVPAGAAGRDGS